MERLSGWEIYSLCVNDILEEYQEIIARKTTPTIAQNVIRAIVESDYVVFVDPHFRLGLITADHDDDKFVDCAFAANATYIVSDDSHFDVLKEMTFPQILVLKLKAFIDLLIKQNNG